MSAKSKESAKFVFQGKVKRSKASNVKAVTDTARTVIVTVNKVVSAPPPLAAFANRDVTVQLAKGEKVKVGQEAIFHTNGWVFGENLAVQSVGHDTIKGTGRKAKAAVAASVVADDPVRRAAHRQIRERVEDAPVVITGRVVAVGLPEPQPALAASAAGPDKSKPISEHDPIWREAVVEVQEIHKGVPGTKRVVVRFPSSTDVQWHSAPKFQVGQEGVFALRADKISGHTAFGAAAASFDTKKSFTCLDVADFQPADTESEAAVAIDAAKK